MKKLTVKERKKAYLKVAEICFNEDNLSGMCLELIDIIGNRRYDYDRDFKEYFPEFILMYPTGSTANKYWDVNDKERALIMCLCSAMCD